MAKAKRGGSKRRGRPGKKSGSAKTCGEPATNVGNAKPSQLRRPRQNDKPIRISKRYCGQQMGKQKITYNFSIVLYIF